MCCCVAHAGFTSAVTCAQTGSTARAWGSRRIARGSSRVTCAGTVSSTRRTPRRNSTASAGRPTTRRSKNQRLFTRTHTHTHTHIHMKYRVSSGYEIRTLDLWFQSEDDTPTQKGLTQKCGRITSVTTFLPLLKTGLVWSDSIYHSAVACTQSCSVYTGLHLYSRRHHTLIKYVSTQIAEWIPSWQVFCLNVSDLVPAALGTESEGFSLKTRSRGSWARGLVCQSKNWIFSIYRYNYLF